MRVGESIGRGSPGAVFSSSLSSSSSEVKLYRPSEDLRASCQTAGTPHVQFVFLRLCLLVGSQKPPQAPRHAQVLLGHPRLSCHAIGCQICLAWSRLLVFLLLATLRGSFFSVCRRYRLHWATFRLCKGAYRRKRVSALPRERLRLPAPVTDSLHAPSKVQRADTPPFRIGLGTPSRWLLLVLWFGLVTPVQAGAHRKLSGTTPEVFTVCGHFAVRLTKSVKRAFKRAQARALVSGSTMYRGQSHSLASLAVRYQGSRPPAARTSSHFCHANGSTLSVLTWNCGGLYSSRWQELMSWLCSQDASLPDSPEIVIIQETHWSHSSEFRSGTWLCIHSGSCSQEGGVLIMVHQRLASKASLRHAVVTDVGATPDTPRIGNDVGAEPDTPGMGNEVGAAPDTPGIGNEADAEPDT